MFPRGDILRGETLSLPRLRDDFSHFRVDFLLFPPIPQAESAAEVDPHGASDMKLVNSDRQCEVFPQHLNAVTTLILSNRTLIDIMGRFTYYSTFYVFPLAPTKCS